MLRTVLGIFLALIFCASVAEAQHADSLRRADSIRRENIKIDTNLLNSYRLGTPRNALPQRLRPVQITPELIPVTMLDYKVSYWHKTVTLGFNFNQSGFSNNWAGGGVNSFALGGNLDYKLEYNKQPFVYTTQLILLYGRSKNRGQLSRKTNDRIFWDNKLATQLSKSWFFYGSLSFESQFDKGFNFDANRGPLLISNFMSPGYVTESLGFEYKPTTYFDLRIGTGTARQTFVLDTTIYRNLSGNYGVTPGRTFKNELAFQATALFDKEIMQNLRLTSRYNIFVPYGRSLKNVDHRLDLTLAARVNRLIAVTITGVALFDNDTSPSIQGNENLALGVIYRFP